MLISWQGWGMDINEDLWVLDMPPEEVVEVLEADQRDSLFEGILDSL